MALELSSGDTSAKNNPVFEDGAERDLEKGGIHNYVSRVHKFMKKVAAEVIGTFFLVFIGCAASIVDKQTNGSISHLGVALVWGMAVMAMSYTVGHVSGAHFNPAVTLAFASIRRFPLKDVPGYIASQFVGAICAGFVLRLLLGEDVQLSATVPTGSDIQSFVTEILITFLLMFVVCSMSTDNRAIADMGGLVVGGVIAMNATAAGPVSGASLNPARTMGSAVAGNIYTSVWIYFVGPIVGAIAGAWSYDVLR